MKGQARVKKELDHEGPDDSVKDQWRVFESS